MIEAKTLGGLLFSIHHHGEHEIIYKEKDVIKLLKKLGFPTPEWGMSIDLEDFELEQEDKSQSISEQIEFKEGFL